MLKNILCLNHNNCVGEISVIFVIFTENLEYEDCIISDRED